MRPVYLSRTMPTFVVMALALLALAGCERSAVRAFSVPTLAPSRTGLLPVPGGAVAGNEAGKLSCIASSGAVRWSTSLGAEIAARPALAKGVVVAASVRGEWVGVDAAEGKERWRLADRSPPVAALASDGERVYALTADGALGGIDPLTGASLWTRPGTARRGERVPGPIVTGGRLVAAWHKELAALDAGTGTLVWKQALENAVGLAGDDRHVYAVTAEGTLAALSASTGERTWSRDLGAPPTSAPSLALGKVWVGLGNPALLSLDPSTGEVETRTPLPAPMTGDVSAWNERVLVPTAGREGFLLAFAPGNPSPLLSLRLDSALRTAPALSDGIWMVAPIDGRVLGYRFPAGR